MAAAAKFDREDVIHRATNLFWEKGFHATSMRNLQEAIDMRPGSIYGTFGSKEGLFKEALNHYANENLNFLKSVNESYDSPLEGVKFFMSQAVKGSGQPMPSKLCMLVKTISELTEDNKELLAEAQGLLGKVEDALTTLLTRAKANGEIPESKDPRRLARFLQMQVMGLRAYVRSNDSADIDELIDDAMTCLH